MSRVFVLLVLVGLFSACSLDMEDNFYFEKIPATNIQTPDDLNLNSQYEFSFDYNLPNNCYNFYNIDYLAVNDTTRIITPFAKVQNGVNCTQSIINDSFRFHFTPTLPKTYIFKFWVGRNDLGADLYEEYEFEIE